MLNMAFLKSLVPYWMMPLEETFTLNNGLQLMVKGGDITKEAAGGVVVGEDENFSGYGAVARALLDAGGEEYQKNREQIKVVIREEEPHFLMYSCPAGKRLNYKNVLHAITSYNGKMPKDWFGHLKTLFFEMGRVAERERLFDLITPLLGTGQAQRPLEIVVQAAIEGLSLLDPKVLKQVTIMEYERERAEVIKEKIKTILSSEGTPTDPVQNGACTPGRQAEDRPEPRKVRTESSSSHVDIFLEESTCMPDGKMIVTTKPHLHLGGFPDCGTILIEYSFPNGIQGPQHPAPGQPYKGTFRRAFLPDNQEGQRVLRLLQKAFDSKLTFQLEQNPDSQEWRVEFADIPHKTCLRVDASGNGYPDPCYLSEVETALKKHGLS